MKVELQNKIVSDFPKLFYYFHNSEISRYPMIYGIETGDGWSSLIYDLCEEIQNWCDKNNKQVRFTQVKQKFGLLRIYLDKNYEEIDNMISIAERKSKEICENCGSLENVYSTTGWIIYLCEKCHKNREKGGIE